ncbi:hypothetical protein [Gordonia sputi]
MATAFAPTVTTRFSSKMRMGAAAVALASAAAFTPAVVHSAPIAAAAPAAQVAYITKGVPYVVKASAAPRATAQSLSDCRPTDYGCYLIEGFKTAGQQFRQGVAYWGRGVASVVGTATFVTLAATGQVFKAIGLNRIGGIFTFVANVIARITRVGPYGT